MPTDRRASTLSCARGMARPASSRTISNGCFLKSLSRSLAKRFRNLCMLSSGASSLPGLCNLSMMLPGWRSPCMKASWKIIRMKSAMLSFAIPSLTARGAPMTRRTPRALSWLEVAPGAAADASSTSRKIRASSVPRSRVSTRTSGDAKSGVGKRTGACDSEKLMRNCRKFAASVSRSVCIVTCSQKSCVARLRPKRRVVSLAADHWPKRRSHARSPSSNDRMPGRMHFSATGVPSSSSAKNT
mmetsp:Transcript_126/g.440  ORF Transcript_126/g.440 Transcript_126/m.440 type:complete len:243 (+) Transcript_126:714-1442(+)